MEDMLKNSLAREKEAIDRERQWAREAVDREKEMAEVKIKNVKLENELKDANAEILKARGRMEPRTLLNYFEDYYLGHMGIAVNKSKRTVGWKGLWDHPDFKPHKQTVMGAVSLATTPDDFKADQFARIVEDLYKSQNKEIHNWNKKAIAIPSYIPDEQKCVMRSICEFLPVRFNEDD